MRFQPGNPYGGPRPNSGGRRPGAGRKSTKVAQYQFRMRGVLLAAVAPEDWRRVVDVAVSQAKAGDAAARQWLTPWIMGAVPKAATEDEGATAPTLRIIVDCEDRAPDPRDSDVVLQRVH